MIDRNKIIKGLEIERECVSRDCDRNCAKCDLVQDREWLLSVYNDTLELLKKKEPLPMFEEKINKCACGNTVSRYYHPKFCGFCGKELMWY